MTKVTFIQAAQELGKHTNTLKNWQKAGRLPSAVKSKVNGKDVWFVDLEEAREVSNNEPTFYQTNANTQPNTQEPLNEPPGSPPVGGLEQSLVFMRESVVRPLVEANERQAARLEQLSRENGELSAELRTVKERLQRLETNQVVTQPAPPAQVHVQEPTNDPAGPAPGAAAAGPPPDPAEVPAKKSSFWQRLFGG